MDRNYTITLENTTDGSSDSPIAGQKEQKGNAGAKVAVKALVAYNTWAKPFAKPFVDFQTQTISLRTGASELQERIQFAYDVGKNTVGISESIIGGFAIGKAPGAIVGALTGVSFNALNYAFKDKKLRYQGSLEEIYLRGANERAGGYAPSYSRSRGRHQ